MILTGKPRIRTLVLIGNADRDAVGGQVVIALLHMVHNGRLQLEVPIALPLQSIL